MTIARTFSSGADRFTVATPDSYLLYFGAGNDWLSTTAGTTIAYLGYGDDYALISGGATTVYGQDCADRIDIHASNAVANGGAGDDVLNIYAGSNVDVAGATGNDRFNFLGDASGVHLSGGDGDDLFVGYSHAISGAIYGGAGNDRFLAFGNHDGQSVVLRGGTGNDLYRLDANSPAIVDERFGEGIDTVQVAHGTSYTLRANVENLSILGGAAGETASLTGNALANGIAGSTGDDTISGLGGADAISGGDGSDYLYGGDGNDRITGGLGIDYMEGGYGSDRFVFTSVADSPSGGPMDMDFIGDWTSIDRIDLSAIDADPNTAGHQSLHFGEAAFGFPAGPQDPGSVVIAGFGGELYVEVYIHGGSDPDMIISLWSAGGEAALTQDSLIF